MNSHMEEVSRRIQRKRMGLYTRISDAKIDKHLGIGDNPDAVIQSASASLAKLNERIERIRDEFQRSRR